MFHKEMMQFLLTVYRHKCIEHTNVHEFEHLIIKNKDWEGYSQCRETNVREQRFLSCIMLDRKKNHFDSNYSLCYIF